MTATRGSQDSSLSGWFDLRTSGPTEVTRLAVEQKCNERDPVYTSTQISTKEKTEAYGWLNVRTFSPKLCKR